jgi:hypothetical protein
MLGFAFGGFTKCMLLERSWAPLDFSLKIVAKLLCSCLCLFDAIFELHAMLEKKNSHIICARYE